MSSGLIRIRGARQHNLKNLDLDAADRRDDGGDRPQRVGQVEPGLRHLVRRGPAPLRRDLQRLRAPVPGPHGPSRRRPRGRRSAGDRHRPDQSGAHQPQHGRHDDRAERPPEAALRPRRRSVRPADGAAGAARHDRDHPRRADAPHRRRRSAPGADLPGRAAGERQRRRDRAMAGGQRLHPDPGRARGRVAHGPSQAARRGGGSLPAAAHREDPRDRGDRDRAQARQRAPGCACRRRRRGAGVALLDRPALSGERPALCRSAAGAVQLQFGHGRLRDLPRLRPGDRRRSRPRDPRSAQDAALGGGQADPDAGLEGEPGRPDEVRRRCRHPARHALAAAHAGPAGMGDRRLAALERPVEQAVVRRPALLRVPRVEGVQDAHPGAAVEVPQLHDLPELQRRAPEDRGAVVAPGQPGRCRQRARTGAARDARRCRLDARPARGAARPGVARPDAAADPGAAVVLRPAVHSGACRSGDGQRVGWRYRAGSATRADRRGHGQRGHCHCRGCQQRPATAADRDPHPAALPVRCRPRLSHARSAEPHAERRRGAAHQPDDRARHLARQHPVRARRAEHRPASARHEPHRRGDPPPARRRQHAGGGRARSGGDARGRPADRHGPGPG